MKKMQNILKKKNMKKKFDQIVWKKKFMEY